MEGWPCSIARTVDLLGDAWTMVVLRELFYGESRFDGFVTSLGIARSTLTNRLETLVSHGVVERREYRSDPVRHAYVLTEKGRDLFGVLAAVNAWGDRWMSDPAGIPVVMHHDACGHDAAARVTCDACGQELRAEDVSARPGDGYPSAQLERPEVRSRFERAGRPDHARHA